ncbi:hypothetical protein BGZ49_007167 [Haplosporangium sp. Z 27]|nr:hypothetical protein BGZ49_007167 [Haplosporangium sp. Z 27]
MLATSNEERPPIIIFQRKEDTMCYTFSGLSIVRYGNIEVFGHFLYLRSTWLLVDCSPKPEQTEARTIFAVSPKTLHDKRLYQEIEKRIVWNYYMDPWTLDELELCRCKVSAFENITKEFMTELFEDIGGVPRYVLEKPSNSLFRKPEDLASARKSAHERVEDAFKDLKDPSNLLKYFEQSMDTMENNGRLHHRWSSNEDHSEFELKWAPAKIMGRVIHLAKDQT